MRIGAGVFTPRWLPTLSTLLMLPVLVWLGTWQMHRLHWKNELVATIAERSHDAPLEIPYVNVEQADYRAGFAEGVFRHDLSFFTYATDLYSGKGGYHVLTPLQLANGDWLLVDRGWIGYENRKNPDSYSQPAGTVKVEGIMRLPSPPNWLLHNNPAEARWYSVDLAAMATADKLDHFLPYVLQAAATPPDAGLPVGGQTRFDLPNDHLSYALTWYSLAAVLLIIYFLSSYERDAKD